MPRGTSCPRVGSHRVCTGRHRAWACCCQLRVRGIGQDRALSGDNDRLTNVLPVEVGEVIGGFGDGLFVIVALGIRAKWLRRGVCKALSSKSYTVRQRTHLVGSLRRPTHRLLDPRSTRRNRSRRLRSIDEVDIISGIMLRTV